MIADATAIFEYTAASKDGRRHSGQVSAPNHEHALRLLSARGLYVTELHVGSQSSTRGRHISSEELAVTLRMLAELLDSGLSLPRALHSLGTLTGPRFAAVLPAIRDAVREGRALTAAMEVSGLRIPPVIVGVIRAGERGGGLANAVREAAEIAESTAATAASVRAALAYPLLLAVFGSAAIALLTGVVLPRFAGVLSDMGSALPPTTRFVLDASAEIRLLAMPVAIIGTCATLVIVAWTRTQHGRLRWHELLLASPWIGETRQAVGSARLAQALAALLSNGTPIAAAIGRAADATGDAAIVDRAAAARAMLEQGARLSDALVANRVVTNLTAQLARAGEDSGKLPDMLRHAASIERARAARRLQGIVRAIEPTLIVAFGGVVAFVALALLQALYSVRPGA